LRSKGIKGKLKAVLSEEEISEFKSSLEIIGDIAIIKLPPKLEFKASLIANFIMKIHRNIRAVYSQASPVLSEYRVRRLKLLFGIPKTEAIHREHGCLFKVDVAETYFSPRLQYERLRIAKLVGNGEVLVNMFAGVGCFSIIAAKHARPSKVYSIDLNPKAYRYMMENVLLNKVASIVKPLLGDSKLVVEEKLMKVADRVLMPLPLKAREYLSSALKALKPQGGWIHYYDFIHAVKGENPVEKVAESLPKKLEGFRLKVSSGRIVRAIGPNWHQVVLDILADKYD
jgi:tRNA (guanine37-N1)-methyltransferase